ERDEPTALGRAERARARGGGTNLRGGSGARAQASRRGHERPLHHHGRGCEQRRAREEVEQKEGGHQLEEGAARQEEERGAMIRMKDEGQDGETERRGDGEIRKRLSAPHSVSASPRLPVP